MRVLKLAFYLFYSLEKKKAIIDSSILGIIALKLLPQNGECILIIFLLFQCKSGSSTRACSGERGGKESTLVAHDLSCCHEHTDLY
jgi:hypothetical protein